MIGWKVVSTQTDRRERRKDIRDQITTLNECLGRVSTHLEQYVGTKPRDPGTTALEARIVSEIQLLDMLVGVLVRAGLPFRDYELIVKLRQAATGGDFGTKSRKVGDAERLLGTAAAAADLIDRIETIYFDTFPIDCRNISIFTKVRERLRSLKDPIARRLSRSS